MSNTPINVCGYPEIPDTAPSVADAAGARTTLNYDGTVDMPCAHCGGNGCFACLKGSNEVAGASEGQAEPVAWLHTMHVEGVQTGECLSFSDKDPWHDMGRYYGEEYVLVSKPLVYTHHPSGD